MLRKLWLRWREGDPAPAREAATAWCRANRIDAAEWARSIDPVLWAEAEAFGDEQRQIGERTLASLGVRMGGGGFYPLLHFLTRLTAPETIVETGVAAGFSSRAFLAALARNGRGRLYSSDFPYFRLAEPERFIGCLVEPELRERWVLMIGSDQDNLPTIARSVERIDLLHYDSDKSHAGRRFALETLKERLTADSLILFDDIQDNLHFTDWVQERGEPFLVFEFKGKWIGLSGGPPALYAGVRRDG